MSNTKSISNKVYSDFERAFKFFNKNLWGGRLSIPTFSIRAKANSHAYFSPNRLATREGDGAVKDPEGEEIPFVHEIAFNPATLTRSSKTVLSTLVHEMVHLWQEEQGSGTPKNGYHNKEWAREMERVGLIPSNTGEEGGAKTGSQMTHYIEKGGEFEKLCEKWLSTNKHAFAMELPRPKKEKPKNNSKTKFTCPVCGSNAWGKPDLDIACRPCGVVMEVNE